MSTGSPPPPPGHEPSPEDRPPPRDTPPGQGPPSGYGPPPGYAPPPGYGPPPYAYGQPYGGYGAYGAREHPQGTTILVLGILGLVLCQIIGPFAWVMGNNALTEIDANPMAYTNRGTVQAGRICGIVATGLLALYVVGFVVVIVVAAATSST